MSGDGTTGYGSVNYSYSIGKYEVTAGQYTDFLNKIAKIDTYGLYYSMMSNPALGSGITRSGGGTSENPYVYAVSPDCFNRPINYISWGDAARFVNWLQNGQPTGTQALSTTEDGAYYLNGATSLYALMKVGSHKAEAKYWIPSENEWYKAAYYKGGSKDAGYWLFPTCSNVEPGQDISETLNPGNNANYYTNPYVWPIESGHNTTVVGAFHLSTSAYGTYDQGGNVWEWNETAITSSSRGVRGGNYNFGWMDIASSFRGENYPQTQNDMGFRIASIPEPSSVTLISMAIIGLFVVCKKRRLCRGTRTDYGCLRNIDEWPSFRG
jgi:formylglycine-generating enzyme required for sulfatase activity